MSSKPIILSGVSAVVFKAREEFEHTTTLENPFKKHWAWFENITKVVWHDNGGATVEQCAPKDLNIHPATQEEEDAYRRAEDEFVSKRILQKLGWSEYEKFCKNHDLPIEAFGCEGPDRQCTMWCPEFGKCEQMS